MNETERGVPFALFERIKNRSQLDQIARFLGDFFRHFFPLGRRVFASEPLVFGFSRPLYLAPNRTVAYIKTMMPAANCCETRPIREATEAAANTAKHL